MKMKQRNGFVSNSSSSSYIAWTDCGFADVPNEVLAVLYDDMILLDDYTVNLIVPHLAGEGHTVWHSKSYESGSVAEGGERMPHWLDPEDVEQRQAHRWINRNMFCVEWDINYDIMTGNSDLDTNPDYYFHPHHDVYIAKPSRFIKCGNCGSSNIKLQNICRRCSRVLSEPHVTSEVWAQRALRAYHAWMEQTDIYCDYPESGCADACPDSKECSRVFDTWTNLTQFAYQGRRKREDKNRVRE